jgi:hypothetical protein
MGQFSTRLAVGRGLAKLNGFGFHGLALVMPGSFRFGNGHGSKSDLAEHVVPPLIAFAHIAHDDVGRPMAAVRLNLKDARARLGPPT